MADTPEEVGAPPLGSPLIEIAEHLLSLEKIASENQRQLRRLSSRVRMANGHRQRVLSLTSALLHQRFRDLLQQLGADTFDIAQAEVDVPYDGLLVALGSACRAPLRRIVLVGTAAAAGRPEFAAELLGASIEVLPTEDARASLPAEGTAIVVTADALLDDAALHASLVAQASIVIVLLGTFDLLQPQKLREAGRRLSERFEADGFETVHVSGAGDMIAFAPRGQIEGGRPESFLKGPRRDEG